MTRGTAAVDSFVLQGKFAEGVALDRPMMEFFERDEFGGQSNNWCAPNIACLLAFCRTAGFARVQLQGAMDFGASVACFREWLPAGPGPAPELMYVIHHGNFGINFDSTRDDSITCVFQSEDRTLSVNDLQPSVDNFGGLALKLAPGPREGLREFGFRLPPGLSAGWHDVRLRVRGGQPSNAQRIAVDIPLGEPHLELHGIRDGCTWRTCELDRSRGEVLSAWIEGLPENADKNNIRLIAGDLRVEVVFI